MPEWVWGLIGSIVNVMIMPIIIHLINRNEKAAKQRADAGKKFNGYILWGMKAIGGLAKANTIAIKNRKANGETDHAMKEYIRFSKSLDRFTAEQTSETL